MWHTETHGFLAGDKTITNWGQMKIGKEPEGIREKAKLKESQPFLGA